MPQVAKRRGEGKGRDALVASFSATTIGREREEKSCTVRGAPAPHAFPRRRRRKEEKIRRRVSCRLRDACSKEEGEEEKATWKWSRGMLYPSYVFLHQAPIRKGEEGKIK